MKPFVQGLRSESAELTRAELWNLARVSGRLVEISGSSASAALTLAFDLVRDAQERGEPVGWVMSHESSFYPPDVAQRGIDLDALVIVRVPAVENAARAGEKLVRSGAFGLVAVDIGAADIAVPLQARLAALALKHHASVIC
ncbi:MAG: recombinase A, partial [Candidatus Binatia bacterium]